MKVLMVQPGKSPMKQILSRGLNLCRLRWTALSRQFIRMRTLWP